MFSEKCQTKEAKIATMCQVYLCKYSTHETEEHSFSVYSDHYPKDISKLIAWQEERLLEERVTV